MPSAEHGFERGVARIVEAVVVAAIYSAFVEAGFVPKIYFTLFNMASIVALVFLIDKSRYWSFGYLAGWILGIIISLNALLQTEFLGWFDLLIYGATMVGAVYLRVKIHS